MTLTRILGTGFLAATLGLVGQQASAQELSFHVQKEVGNTRLGFSIHGTPHRPPTIGFHASNGFVHASRTRSFRPVDLRPVDVAPVRCEYVEERVWIPGSWERVWIDPVFRDTRDSCGRIVRVLIREGYWQNVQRPGHYEIRRVPVTVPYRYGHSYSGSHYARYGAY